MIFPSNRPWQRRQLEAHAPPSQLHTESWGPPCSGPAASLPGPRQPTPGTRSTPTQQTEHCGGLAWDRTLNRYTSRFWPLGQNKTVPCHDLETALRPQYIRGVDCMGVHKPATGPHLMKASCWLVMLWSLPQPESPFVVMTYTTFVPDTEYEGGGSRGAGRTQRGMQRVSDPSQTTTSTGPKRYRSPNCMQRPCSRPC